MPKKHQIKSSRYYWFWGLCTIAVCSGQLYVGAGYRKMANSLERVLDTITFQIEKPPLIRLDPPPHPMIIPNEDWS